MANELDSNRESLLSTGALNLWGAIVHGSFEFVSKEPIISIFIYATGHTRLSQACILQQSACIITVPREQIIP